MTNTYTVGANDTRPWGRWTTIDVGERHVTKLITVKPGAKLSLQLHHGRDEHWIVVRGAALVRLGTDTFAVRENEHVFIPRKTPHRLENPGSEDLAILEIQYGDMLDEKDIVRLEDIYGRA